MGKESCKRAETNQKGAFIDLWGVGINLGECVGFLLFVQPEESAAMCVKAFVEHDEEGAVVEVGERGERGGERGGVDLLGGVRSVEGGGASLVALFSQGAALALDAPQEAMKVEMMGESKEREVEEVQDGAANIGALCGTASEQSGAFEQDGIGKPKRALGGGSKAGKEGDREIKERIERRVQSSGEA